NRFVISRASTTDRFVTTIEARRGRPSTPVERRGGGGPLGGRAVTPAGRARVGRGGWTRGHPIVARRRRRSSGGFGERAAGDSSVRYPSPPWGMGGSKRAETGASYGDSRGTLGCPRFPQPGDTVIARHACHWAISRPTCSGRQ